MLGVVLFAPAGSPGFWQAWLFMALFFTSSPLLAVYFHQRDPGLLERRLEAKEEVSEQKLFRRLWLPLWAVGLSLPGFDYRYGWSGTLGSVPLWLTLLALALVTNGPRR
jgi:hypothetical protein